MYVCTMRRVVISSVAAALYSLCAFVNRSKKFKNIENKNNMGGIMIINSFRSTSMAYGAAGCGNLSCTRNNTHSYSDSKCYDMLEAKY
jgi:hypothetical protein